MKRPRVPAPGEFAAESLEVLLLSLPPRRRLPSERLLCEKWDVSRGTLRTVLRHLTAAGRLVAMGGSGYIVAPPRPEWDVSGELSLSEALRRPPHRLSGKLLEVWTAPNRLNPDREGRWIDIRVLWLSDQMPIALEESSLRYESIKEAFGNDPNAASLLRALTERRLCQDEKLHISILHAQKEETELLSVPEGKALIQICGFEREADGSLRENHRVILRPDRIHLTL